MRTYVVFAVLLAACGAPASPDAGRDAGTERDAGRTGTDAGRDAADAARPDATGRDASQTSCNPDAVRFEYLAMGPLQEGTFCDELIVCARDAAEEARIEAASSLFECSGEPHALCSSARTCAYEAGGPHDIDLAELAEICAVTLLVPTPDVVCVVYGP